MSVNAAYRLWKWLIEIDIQFFPHHPFRKLLVPIRVLLNPPTTNQPTSDHLLTDPPTNRPPT